MRIIPILLLCLLATSALANSNRVMVLVKEDVKDPDKTLVKLDAKTYFNDTKEVPWEQWTRLTETSTGDAWRMMDFTVDLGTVDKKDKTDKGAKEKFDKNVSEKDKVRTAYSGIDLHAGIVAAGYTITVIP